MKKLKIALVSVTNKEKKTAMNKDLNGGFGTSDDYGYSLPLKLLKLIKRNTVKLPVITFAYLQAIFQEQYHYVEYFEKKLPKQNFDLILIHGTIVDYQNEIYTYNVLKKRFPDAKIGFFGPFPATIPSLFEKADFIIKGEPEYFFLKEFNDINQLNGIIKVSSQVNMEELPSPNFDNFPIKSYNYFPAISKKPFLVLQSSRGCPYSCRYYCAYGQFQGCNLRQRSAKKVVEDMIFLKNNYNVRGIQFRDPTFGISKSFVKEFYEELKKKNLKIEWGIETRLDLLTKEIITKLYEVGLRNINIGIETPDNYIAKVNKRTLTKFKHQEEIVEFCKNLGVNVSSFYILGLEKETERTINSTINYAIKLNTLLARFAVSTPYPGTEFYKKLEKENKLLTKDFEKYNQFTLIYEHENLKPEEIEKLLEKAYKKYYFRASYINNFIKSKIKSLLV